MKLRLWPRSLLGQMLFAVAATLLVAQAISAILLVHAQTERREAGAANALAFQLVAEPRVDFRRGEAASGQARPGPDGRDLGGPDRDGPDPDGPELAGKADKRWQRLRIERTGENPVRANEVRDEHREELLAAILAEQGVDVGQLLVVTRNVATDSFLQKRMRERLDWKGRPGWADKDFIVAALQRKGESDWTVARMPVPQAEPRTLGGIVGQTLILYIALVGGLALVLRRITRPLAALTRRMEHFARTRETDGQLEPAGPSDTRQLIEAHNAMEARIAALLNEKDVMLGAIGHDLKTPLAALRVRIEIVEDAHERARMAASIEDITRTLDDILSLARVGRPSDTPETTDLSALAASVVEEFEDMGERVTLGDTERIAGSVRATWLRRALRNLVGNALRYGGGAARVSLVRQDGEVIFRIEDDGPGIPDNEIEAMLQPFRRGEASRNRETGGAGLGLTLAKAIAEQHGGRLIIANRYADGATAGLTAEIRLPI